MNQVHPRKILNQALRTDLTCFIERSFREVVPGERLKLNWHYEAIAHALECCESDKITRLIITMPPRSLKSICATVAFPAWLLGRNPTERIVCVSYSHELASKHARDCRAVVTSPWYQYAFPGMVLDKSKNSEQEFTTTQRGYRLTTSVGGTLTGRGGNYIIIDDPLKPQDAYSKSAREGLMEWYDSTLYSRLDSKENGRIILVMQRLHESDLVGHVLEKEGWMHLNLPAIAITDESIPLTHGRYHSRRTGDVLHPAQESRETLAEIRSTIGTSAFEAQYQQQPAPEQGGLLHWEWFRTYDVLPQESSGLIVQSWDTASKAGELNDYSVCTTWRAVGKNYYLIDVFRQRLEYPALRHAYMTLAQRYRPWMILVEDAGTGTSLVQEARRGDLGPIKMPRPVKQDTDKIVRAAGQTGVLESGRVHVPRNAPWLDAFRNEVVAFPGGRHDDQVDSMIQFLAANPIPKPTRCRHTGIW